MANRDSGNVSMYTVDASTGTLTANGTIAARNSPYSVTVDPTGRFAYAATGTGVSMYTINADTGALMANGNIFTVAGRSIAVDPTCRFVYVANNGSANVSMFTINPSTGALTSNGTIAAGTSPTSITVY